MKVFGYPFVISEFDDLEDKEKVEKMICEWERICEEVRRSTCMM